MLRQILAMTRKDLLVLVRNRGSLGTLFLMPVVLLVVMTLALSGLYAGADRARGMPNVVEQNVPGWLLFGVFFIAQVLAGSLARERADGTFRRLLAAPVSRAGALLGKVAPFLLVNLGQVAVMTTVGVLVLPLLGAPRLALGGHAAAMLGITLAASLTATGLGLLLATVERVAGFGSLLVVTMAALGGVMVPRRVMPHALAELGLLTPHAWALDGYQQVLVRGAGLPGVLPNLAALLAFAIAFFALALWRFRWE